MIKLVTIIFSTCKVMNKRTKALIATIVRGLLYLLIIIHLAACCLKLIADLDHLQNWICVQIPIFPNLQNHSELEGQCSDHLISNSSLYIACLYIIMMTLTGVGYGDYSVKTPRQRFFMIFILLLGIGFFGTLMGRVNRVVSLLNIKNELKTSRYQNLETFLLKLDRANRQRPLNTSFIEVIWNHFDQYWSRNNKYIKQDEYFNQIPPGMQNEVRFQQGRWQTIYSTIFSNNFDFSLKILRWISEDKLQKMLDILPFKSKQSLNRFPKRTFSLFQVDSDSVPQIFKKGQIPKSVIFILSGSVQLCSGSGSYKYLRLKAGSFFGESYILTDTPSSYALQFKIKDQVQALEIQADTFRKICNKFPHSKKIVKERGLKRREKWRQKKQFWLKELKLKLEQSIIIVNTSITRLSAFKKSIEASDTSLIEADNLLDQTQRPMYSRIKRKNSKSKKKKLIHDPNFAHRESEVFRKRKRYLESNLQDPEIGEELGVNSQDEYTLNEGIKWIQKNQDSPHQRELAYYAQDLLDIQSRLDLVEMRMEYLTQKIGDKLDYLVMLTNTRKSTFNKEALKRRNTITHFAKNKGSRKGSDNNSNW